MKFRKKQIIEAVQVTDEWFISSEGSNTAPHIDIPVGVTIHADTKEVVMGGIEPKKGLVAKVGWWIVIGDKKMYPIANEDFQKMYEPVEGV